MINVQDIMVHRLIECKVKLHRLRAPEGITLRDILRPTIPQATERSIKEGQDASDYKLSYGNGSFSVQVSPPSGFVDGLPIYIDGSCQAHGAPDDIAVGAALKCLSWGQIISHSFMAMATKWFAPKHLHATSFAGSALLAIRDSCQTVP